MDDFYSYEYYDPEPITSITQEQYESNVFATILSNLDKILKSQESMMQRLDAIEKQHAQYLSMSENSVSGQSSSGTQCQNGPRWTEEEHQAYLRALETIPK